MIINILGVKINKVMFQEALATVESFISTSGFHLVTTVNPEFILKAQEDPSFKEILNAADLSLPDGVGVQMAAKYLRETSCKGESRFAPNFVGRFLNRPYRGLVTGIKVGMYLFFNKNYLDILPERIAGSDLFLKLCELSSQKGWRVGLLGGTDYKGQDVCQLTKLKLESIYPGIKMTYCSREASDQIFKEPLDLLFVAFGAPKQEKWLWEHRRYLSQVKIGMGVGGTFDYLIGKRRRAPLWLQNCHLEWLWRVIIEPRRLGRIFRAVVVFPWRVFLSSLIDTKYTP